MQIKLENIMPHPLRSIQHEKESIWGQTTILQPKAKILLNASSGKGKSTFLSTVFGLRNDYDGFIYYDDNNIKSLSIEEWTNIRQQKISVVFQDLQLFPKLSVKENLLLKNELTNKKSESDLLNELDLMGIKDKWNQSCGTLSMGQQQRVAIIRALSQPFEWIILDEPFSHLDDKNAEICMEMITQEVKKEDAGIILTSLEDNFKVNFDVELKL